MDRDSIAFFVFYLLGNLAVAMAIVQAWMVIYRPVALDRLLDTAFRNEGKSLWDDFPSPIYHPRRVWRIAFIVASMLGFGIVFYGIFIRLFGWMPYEWRATEDDIWAAEFFAGIAAFLSFMGLLSWGAELQKRIARHRALEFYKSAIERFEIILAHLLTCPMSAVDFWARYAERFLSYQCKMRVLVMEADRLVGIVRAIKAYRQRGQGVLLDERVRQNLADHSIATSGFDHVEEPSQKAITLIEYIRRERDRLELFDDGDRLREIVPKSPDGWSPPGFRISQSTYNDDGPVFYTGSTSVKPRYEHRRERLIENVLWSDQQGVIDQVDDYLRNKARWQFTRLK